MTLDELISNIEAQGYELNGKIAPLGPLQVLRAVMCFLPEGQFVEGDWVMIDDVLTWDRFRTEGWSVFKGYARIEGAATLAGMAVRLQFFGKTA